ncbi:MAG: WhiB family transcriptional regulator [Motilibacteraceae bacterium]
MKDDRLKLPEWHALADALDEVATPCQGEDRELWFAGKPKDRAIAADRCFDCTVLAACHEYAEAAGERWGVWAGVDRETEAKHRGRHD